jgi:CheY-like chemotaxis protein
MRTILIIDDDPISVRLLEMIVARNGYATASATSAEEAVDWLEQGEPVELIITDQNLGGTTGLEFYQSLQGNPRFRSVPVILCTGVADRDTVTTALALGIRHLIAKPITPKVVLEKIAAVLADRLQVMESRESAIGRLGLTDVEYKALVRTSMAHIGELRDELDLARKNGDRVTAVELAQRLVEPAQLLVASPLLESIERLGKTKTWHDFEVAFNRVMEEVQLLLAALDHESKPHLIGKPLTFQGPDAY